MPHQVLTRGSAATAHGLRRGVPSQVPNEPALGREPVERGAPRASASRTALVNRLRAARSHPLTTLVAPAGYGKTTVLSQWATRDGRAFARVSLDERDSDPLVLLEINTQPGMTSTSLVPDLAAHAGHSFEDLVVWMVNDASVDR